MSRAAPTALSSASSCARSSPERPRPLGTGAPGDRSERPDLQRRTRSTASGTEAVQQIAAELAAERDRASLRRRCSPGASPTSPATGRRRSTFAASCSGRRRGSLVREIGERRLVPAGRLGRRRGEPSAGDREGGRARKPGSPAAPSVVLGVFDRDFRGRACGPPTPTRCTSSASRATATPAATGSRPRPPRSSTRGVPASSRSRRRRAPRERARARADPTAARRSTEARSRACREAVATATERGSRGAVPRAVARRARGARASAGTPGAPGRASSTSGTAAPPERRRPAPSIAWNGGVPVTRGRGRGATCRPRASRSPRRRARVPRAPRPPRCRTGTPRRRAPTRLARCTAPR